MSTARYSAGLWAWGTLGDRFNLEGYRRALDPAEAIRLAKAVRGVSGVELTHPDNVNDGNLGRVKDALDETGLAVSSIYCNLSSEPRWQRGAFTAGESLREAALGRLKRTMELSKELGARQVTFSLLQDGYDYCFQCDYPRTMDLVVETLKEAAGFDPDVRIAVEYKPREPRVFCVISTTAAALLIVRDVDRPNVGVTIDVGHALMAGENMAEAICLLARYGKLFHIHLNDNYRRWDDDLIVGSVHLLETLEMVYWLRRLDYKGWWGLDIFPYREDPGLASERSIRVLEKCHEILDRLGMERVSGLIGRGNPPAALGEILDAVLGG